MRQVAMGIAVDWRVKRVLMSLRHLDVLRPNMWEYPGGKVEVHRGETPKQAAEREGLEELGIRTLVVGDELGRTHIPFEDGGAICIAFHVTLIGNPKPLASQRLDWVDPEQAIRYLPCVPSTYMFFPHVMKLISDGASP